MLYVNVPLPKPLVDKIDEIVSDEYNSFRSRPDFILQHIRDVVDRHIEKKQGQQGQQVQERQFTE